MKRFLILTLVLLLCLSVFTGCQNKNNTTGTTGTNTSTTTDGTVNGTNDDLDDAAGDSAGDILPDDAMPDTTPANPDDSMTPAEDLPADNSAAGEAPADAEENPTARNHRGGTGLSRT